MKIKNKNKYGRKKMAFFGAAIFCAVFFVFYYLAQADNTNLSNSDDETAEETQEKIDELNRKAEVYRQIIEIKEKQGESLNNQLSITDSNIKQVQAQIDLSTQQIYDFNNQILRLEKQIQEKEELLESQKKMLANIMQSFYAVNQSGLMVAFLNNGNIASFIVTNDRISQTGDKISELVNSIAKIKKNLELQKEQLDRRKTEVVTKNQELQDQNDDLESVKKQRETLLNQTQGEEEKYRKLLASIQKQKEELLNIDELFGSSGLSVDNYAKPPSSLYASTDWYYSQRDSRWADVKIGISGLKMKDYGCAVSSVAMVFTKMGDSITPLKLVKKPIYTQGGLIVWPDSSFGNKVSLTSGTSHGNIKWKTIDSQLAKGNPVIVYIKKNRGSGGHYVVIHHKESSTGKYVVHDPYFGANIYLDTSRALVGAMGTDSSTTVDQMIIYN